MRLERGLRRENRTSTSTYPSKRAEGTSTQPVSIKEASAADKKSGSALKPFRASGPDPLLQKDPWHGASFSSGGGPVVAPPADPQVLSRLQKAEDAIGRIEARQDQTDRSLQGMQEFMGARFQEVMAALSDMQTPKRKVRHDEQDHRGGRVTTWTAANITSLPKRWKQVASWNSPVIALTETLVHQDDDDWLRLAFKGCGRTYLRGAPCVTVGEAHARKAGVGILCGEEFYALPLPVPEALQEQYHQARLMYAMIGARHAQYKIRCIVYYGTVCQPDANAGELLKIIEECDLSPDIPTMIAGDFNIHPDHLFWSHVVSHPCWQDPHSVMTSGGESLPTCWPVRGPPTCIDYFVVNNMFAGNVTAVGRDLTADIPVHIPITLDIQYEAMPLSIAVLPSPIPLMTKAPEPAFREDFFQCQQELEAKILAARLDEAYRQWSDYWETWLLTQHQVEGRWTRYRGRGNPPKIKAVHPKSPRVPATSEVEAFLDALLGRLAELRRMQDREGVEYQRLLAKVMRQVQPLMNRFGPPPTLPENHVDLEDSPKVLLELYLHVQAIRDAERKKNAVSKRRFWRQGLLKNAGANRSLSQAVRKTTDKLLASLGTGESGSDPVFSVAAMMELLTDFWNEVHSGEGPDDEAWKREFLYPCPAGDMPRLDPIRGETLRTQLMRMRVSSARGPDAWSVVELRALPPPALEQLALILNGCEAFEVWPEAFQEVHTTLLQKKVTSDHSSVRPIGVACIPYRLWSSARFRDLQPWAEGIYHPSQTAYRSHHDTQAISLERALKIEAALFAGRPQTVVSLDLSKAFDRVSHTLALAVCEHFRMPGAICALVKKRLAEVRFRWKILGCVSGLNYLKRGIIQGCAMSCLIFNLAITPLLYAVERDREAAPLEAHADDLYMQHHEEPQVQQTCRTVQRYLHLAGVPIQPAKTQVLRAPTLSLAPLEVLDTQIPPSSELRALGQEMGCKIPAAGHPIFSERLSVFLQRVENVSSLKLPWDVRRKMVQSMCLSVLDYCPWMIPAHKVPASARSAVIRCLFPNVASHRCGEVLLMTYTPMHVTDPFCALTYRLILQLDRHARKQQQVEEQMWYAAASRMGPKSLLFEVLRSLGLDLRRDGIVGTPWGQIPVCGPEAEDQHKKWCHNWREILRRAIARKAVERRPLFQGIQDGIDRRASTLLYDAIENQQWRYHLIAITGDAVITKATLAKMFTDVLPDCPYCGQEETAWHRHWECENWQHLRDLWLPEHDPQHLPLLLRQNGILLVGHGLPVGLILRVQALMLHIDLMALSVDHAAVKRQPIHEWPHPALIQVWMNKPSVRKHRPEPVLQLEPLSPPLPDEPIQIGEHLLEPNGTGFWCLLCGKTYSEPHMDKFSACPCDPDVGPRSKALTVKPSKNSLMLWQFRFRKGPGHVYMPVKPGGKDRLPKLWGCLAMAPKAHLAAPEVPKIPPT